MTEPTETIDPTVVQPPMVIEPTATKAAIGTLLAAVTIAITGTTSVIGFLSAHDLVAVFKFLQGAEGVAYLAALGLIGTVATRIWLSVRKHSRLTFLQQFVDDSIAKLKGK